MIPEQRLQIDVVPRIRSYSYAEIRAATLNFGEKVGVCGSVFKGVLNNQEVAVKVRPNASTHDQGLKEFENEIAVLSRVSHKKVVPLLGYCQERQKLILVFEHMPEGSLREHLYGEREQLDWRQRLEIALDAAEGMKYLHHEIPKPIIHRDLTSANILLDACGRAKVANFGIVRRLPDPPDPAVPDVEATSVLTEVRGSEGYVDPRYSATERLSRKSDVYSFGVVLLEIICGEPPVIRSRGGYIHTLVKNVRKKLEKNELDEVVDRFVHNKCSKQSVYKVATLAMSCLGANRDHRPDFFHIVIGLGEALDCELSNTQ